jgi:predicted dehydrogenase
MSKHRIAVIGAGMAFPPHAQSLRDLSERVEVAGVYTLEAAQRDKLRATHGFPIAQDLQSMIDDRSIDTALVLTPPHVHLPLIRRLAAAGKHVLVEKPLAVTTADAVAATAACEAAGVCLAVVLQHRFRPAALALAKLVAAGALGAVANAAVAVRWWRPQSYYNEPGRGTLARDGGGVLLSQAIHTLDLFLTLAPPLAEVTAFAGTSPLHQMETEDTAAGALRFANGALGSIDATTAAYPGFTERIELIGSAATAVLAGTRLDVYTQDGRRETLGEEGGTGGGADPMAFVHDHHRAVLGEFLDALDEGRAPRNSGRSALPVLELIDALLESSRRRAPVAVGAARGGPAIA